MDVLSLLKFWRTAGDEASFFDLEFTATNCCDSNSNNNNPFNTKRRILPLDSSCTKRPSSPFRVLKLGFQNKKTKSDMKEMKCETEEFTISSLLKSSSEKYLDHDQMSSKRCLNLIKPLYVRVSKRSNENVRLPDQSPRKEEKKLGEIVFNEVRKHWGKRRSSSSVKPAPSPAMRSDDSALQQDGIQSAILHCKMSYDSPSTVSEWHVLSRSGSAPSSHGHRISVDEIKRSSI